jgi:hypothetical protein
MPVYGSETKNHNMVDDVTQMAEAWRTNYKAYHNKIAKINKTQYYQYMPKEKCKMQT